MANEVVIVEYAAPELMKNGVPLNVNGPVVTSQTVSTGSLSAALNALTRMVQINVKSTAAAAVWVIVGTASASAAANTAGNIYIPIGGSLRIQVNGGQYIDTAADA